ncbi:MAG: PEP-CTERM sorting domain-containing protein [Candidatus Nealsonbacteria bacterium]|nr:PEP-CTERM sorting domain-containing protein [Candidatus Nealsonbacteria bacterium]
MRHWIIVLALLAILIGVGQVDAEVFTGATFDTNGNGSASVDPAFEPGSEEIRIFKEFTAMGPIDTQFSLEPGGASIMGLFIREEITNNTGVAWGDYHFQLGFGLGDEFTPSGVDDGLSFVIDNPMLYQSDHSIAFPNNLPGNPDGQGWDSWDFWGGNVQPNGTVILGLQLADTGQRSSFTLRQQPSPIPEPSTLILLTMGAVGLQAYGWRRRKAGSRP